LIANCSIAAHFASSQAPNYFRWSVTHRFAIASEAGPFVLPNSLDLCWIWKAVGLCKNGSWAAPYAQPFRQPTSSTTWQLGHQFIIAI